MLQLILAIGGPAAGLLVSLYLLWRLESSKRRAEANLSRALVAEEAVANIRSALTSEIRRLEAQVRVLRSTNQACREQMAKVATLHPELATEYLRGVLRRALDADPDPSSVPVHPTAKAPTGSSNR